MQIQTIYREEEKRTRSNVDCNPRCFHGWRRCTEPFASKTRIVEHKIMNSAVILYLFPRESSLTFTRYEDISICIYLR